MAKAPRKKKENELLSSVVQETAASAAVELLRNNQRFALPEGDGWLVLALDADKIGGLCAKDNRDADKGGIIQLISADEIQTVATRRMLDENFFGIIPNGQSLGRMSEYSLLTDAVYAWGKVTEEDGDLVVDTIAEASYADAVQIEAGTMDYAEIEALAKELAIDAPSADNGAEVASEDDSEPATEAVDIVTDEQVEDPEGDPLFDVNPGVDLDDEPDLPENWVPSEEDEQFEVASEGELDLDSDFVPVYGEEGGYDDEDSEDDESAADFDDDAVIADQSQIMDTLVRRFLTEDLDLHLDLEEFNKSFSVGMPLVQIEMPTGASEWLGDQIGHLTRQANASLAQLHTQNAERLRAEYVNLMSLHVEKVIRNVSPDRDGGRFQELQEFARSLHQRKLENKVELIRVEKDKLSEEFENSAKEASTQAALDAERRYKERHRSRLAREQVEAAAAIEASIEADFENDTQRILELRRVDAENQMSEGTTRVSEVLRELHESNLSSEQQMLDSWTQKIEKLIADHRANDVSRVNVLAEDQARFNEVEELNGQQQRLIESMELEHADRLRRSEAETERIREQGVAALEARDREWQHQVELEKHRADASDARADEYGKRMETIGATSRESFEAQLADQTRLINTQQAELDNREASQKSWTRMMGFSMVAGFILAMLIGVVLGVFLI